MNPKLKALLAEVKALQEKNDGLVAKANDLTQEDIGAMEANSAAIREKRAQAAVLADAETLSAEVTAELRSVVTDVPAGAASHVATTRSGVAEIDAETREVFYRDGDCLMDEKTFSAISSVSYKEAHAKYVRKGKEGLSSAELRTLQEGSDPAGGFLVTPEILNRLIQKSAAPTRVAGQVEQINISRDSVQMPCVNYATDDIYTTSIRSAWTGEVPSSSTVHRATEPVFGQKRIQVFTNMLSLPLTNDLVEDSAFPLLNWATGKFEETIALLKDNMILNGTGIGQPSGILLNPNGTDQPATVNLGNPITSDGIVDIAWSLPEQYEDSSTFVFNKTSVGKTLAKLKDGDGRYLWGQGLQDSGLMAYGPAARMLAGKPVTFSAFMPDAASAANVMIYGDLKGYALVNRIGFSVQVLRELYAETNQILLLGRVRFGGAVLEPFRMKIGVQS